MIRHTYASTAAVVVTWDSCLPGQAAYWHRPRRKKVTAAGSPVRRMRSTGVAGTLSSVQKHIRFRRRPPTKSTSTDRVVDITSRCYSQSVRRGTILSPKVLFPIHTVTTVVRFPVESLG